MRVFLRKTPDQPILKATHLWLSALDDRTFVGEVVGAGAGRRDEEVCAGRQRASDGSLVGRGTGASCEPRHRRANFSCLVAGERVRQCVGKLPRVPARTHDAAAAVRAVGHEQMCQFVRHHARQHACVRQVCLARRGCRVACASRAPHRPPHRSLTRGAGLRSPRVHRGARSRGCAQRRSGSQAPRPREREWRGRSL